LEERGIELVLYLKKITVINFVFNILWIIKRSDSYAPLFRSPGGEGD